MRNRILGAGLAVAMLGMALPAQAACDSDTFKTMDSYSRNECYRWLTGHEFRNDWLDVYSPSRFRRDNDRKEVEFYLNLRRRYLGRIRCLPGHRIKVTVCRGSRYNRLDLIDGLEKAAFP